MIKVTPMTILVRRETGPPMTVLVISSKSKFFFIVHNRRRGLPQRRRAARVLHRGARRSDDVVRIWRSGQRPKMQTGRTFWRVSLLLFTFSFNLCFGYIYIYIRLDQYRYILRCTHQLIDPANDRKCKPGGHFGE